MNGIPVNYPQQLVVNLLYRDKQAGCSNGTTLQARVKLLSSVLCRQVVYRCREYNQNGSYDNRKSQGKFGTYIHYTALRDIL